MRVIGVACFLLLVAVTAAAARTGRPTECLHHLAPSRCGAAVSVEDHSTCIVGAGPAGLQLARLFQEAGQDYVVLERNNSVGAFFHRFPRHRRLISINKVNTGSDSAEEHLRHDWHSLLTTGSPSSDNKGQRIPASAFTYTAGNYSDEYYPHADTLVRYLHDYASHFALDIRLRHRVAAVYQHPAPLPADKQTSFFVEVETERYDQNQGGWGLWVGVRHVNSFRGG